ncbi:MAG: hypothetical protein AB1486_01390 [Planctomycetota bacterium]
MKPLVISLALLVVTGVAPQALQDQEPVPVEKQLEELRQALDAERLARGALEERVVGLEAQVKALLAWTSGLDRASSLLSAAVENARKNGFEAAAPNPRARTDILEGMLAFSRALLEGRPLMKPSAVKPAETKEGGSGSG